MSYLVDTPTIKKKFCKHKYETFFPQGKRIEACKKCEQRKPRESSNAKLTEFVDPAFKQSKIPEGYNEEFFWKYQFNTNWDTIQHDSWGLPATGEPHEDCGVWQRMGCPNVNGHKCLGQKGKIYVRQYQRSCFRAICKKCYKKWIGRGANRATRRIEEYINRNSGQKPIHVFFSPPRSIHYLSYEKLKNEFRIILKKSGIIGGAIIFHPFRFDKSKRQWNWSPHFHLVGFGSVRNIQNVFGWKGWYVGNRGVRKSVFHTFHYLLSHSGIRKKFHTLTWIGDLSYCNLRLDPEPRSDICPGCGQKLVPIYHEGEHSGIPPSEIFEGFVDPEGWHLVYIIPESEFDNKYDYAPTRDLNETLKGLAMAN